MSNETYAKIRNSKMFGIVHMYDINGRRIIKYKLMSNGIIYTKSEVLRILNMKAFL